jgi:hypothetical protein
MASVSSSASGFVSGGPSWGGSVVVRFSRSGWAWVWRAPRSASGSWPAPSALCVPFPSRALAVAWARQVARLLGWRAWVRPAKRCATAFEVKLALPVGLSARVARAKLPPFPSSLVALL